MGLLERPSHPKPGRIAHFVATSPRGAPASLHAPPPHALVQPQATAPHARQQSVTLIQAGGEPAASARNYVLQWRNRSTSTAAGLCAPTSRSPTCASACLPTSSGPSLSTPYDTSPPPARISAHAQRQDVAQCASAPLHPVRSRRSGVGDGLCGSGGLRGGSGFLTCSNLSSRSIVQRLLYQ